MTVQYRILRPHDVQVSGSNREFAQDVSVGLSWSPKSIPSKYLYDAEGDRLFRQITKLPEYYLTGCECEILQSYKGEMADTIGGDPFNLVELGAGDGHKAEILFEHFLRRELSFQYIPIDISETAMQGLVGGLAGYFPRLKIEGLVTEYFDGLKWLSNLNEQHNVVLFLGSNIGNFNHSEAVVFLHSLWNALNGGDYVLIGFDLKKDIQKLLRAYNDSQGITAQFNLNLLRRINGELGGNFNLDRFQYYSTYDVLSGAIESYLVSCGEQVAYIEVLGKSYYFQIWEPLHTEHSRKFLESDIRLLAQETGFKIISQWSDSKQYFMNSLWQVKKR